MAGAAGSAISTRSKDALTWMISEKRAKFRDIHDHNQNVITPRNENPSSPVHHQIRAFEVLIHTSKDRGRAAFVFSVLAATWMPQLLNISFV